MQIKDLENMIREIIMDMGDASSKTVAKASSGVKVTKKDYPLGEKSRDLLKTPTGKSLDQVTLDGIMNGEVTGADVRITPETLELQAQVAESCGRDKFAGNLRRAAELIAVPDERILQIYNALRPYRSTKGELLEIANELETTYNAKVCAGLVREAAAVGESRRRLKGDQ